MPRDYYTVKASGRSPLLRFTSRETPMRRMDPVEYTRTLTRPLTPVGLCHCGATGLLFPEYGPGAKGSLKLVAWHCWLCRCDEHVAAEHAARAASPTPQNHGQDNSKHPGCGGAIKGVTRGCERNLLDGPPEFPSFKDWVKTNGSAALRKAAKEHKS